MTQLYITVFDTQKLLKDWFIDSQWPGMGFSTMNKLVEIDQDEVLRKPLANNSSSLHLIAVMNVSQMFSRYKPLPEDQLQKAFEVLDTEKKGHLTVEELTKLMTEEGMYSMWYNNLSATNFYFQQPKCQ